MGFLTFFILINIRFFEKKHHFKKGGTMEPYRGSYISGKVDGKMLSNPSLRKYYKGLI